MDRNKPSVPSYKHAPENHAFLASPNRSFQYAALYGFATWLQDELAGIEFSDDKPFLILADSSDEHVFLIAALFLLKIPFIPLHPETTEQELQSVLEKFSPGAVYTDQVERFIDYRSLRVLSIPEEVLHLSGDWNPGLFSLEQPETTAGIFFTSGSTGESKIVPVKRRQVLFATHSSEENFRPDPNCYWLLCLPLNHVGGIGVVFRSVLYGSAIYRQADFDESEIRKFLSENKSFQVASMVPTMLIRMMNDPLFQVHFDFKAILVGGGPISLDVINKALTKGLPIVTSYGMTETFGQIAANAMLKPSGMYNPKMSVGPLFSPNEIEIRDEHNSSVPKNESGIIWLRGPQVINGYFDESLNQDVFDEEGWFNTGDQGHLNRKDQLFIETRRTDLIITGGENVSPFEIEFILNSFDHIRESAVVGIPDKKWGQKVVAFIVSDREDLSTEVLRQELRKALRGFKVPKEIIRIDHLPKTATHKIKRSDLIRAYSEVAS